MLPLAAAVALSLGAVVDVPAGAPLAPALAAARAGDVIRLGPGRHAGTLGVLAGVVVEGAGAGVTRVVVPDGDDGAIVRGGAALTGLSLEAGRGRTALVVLAGEATLDDVALSGELALVVNGGRVVARRVALRGDHGLVVRDGEARVEEADLRGDGAAIAVLGGAVTVRRASITGPSLVAAVTVARGAASLDAVVIRAPGTTGLSVSHGGTVDGQDVTIVGATESAGMLGACAAVQRATLRLDGATLACAGTAVEASGGVVRLRGVDAAGGEAGCVVLVNGAEGDLEGNVCAGRGPGLVVGSGARAALVANRWWTTPTVAVDCAGGARVEVGRGEAVGSPCAPGP